jgi:hypothetical protein
MEAKAMFPKAIFGCLLALAGCGLHDEVVVEVDADSRFMGRIDHLELSAQSLSPGSGFISRLDGNPLVLPATFTIPLHGMRAAVEANGGVGVSARAWWNNLEIAQGKAAEPEALDGWVTFRRSPVKLTLTTTRLDILRNCESHGECATSYCGSKNFSKSLTFCTKECTTDSDCPGQARCSSKYGIPICLPACKATQEVCKVVGVPFYPFPDWECDTDHDGLCGFAP